MGWIGNLDRLDAIECAGWVLDRRHPETTAKIRLLVNGQERAIVTADLQRDDVMAVHGSAMHGFSFGISEFLDRGKNTVEIEVLGCDFRMTPEPVSVDTRDAADFVEEGRNGWLFLRNDTNDVRATALGERPLSPGESRRLRLMFARRHALLAQRGIASLTWISPEKGIACNGYRREPLTLSENRPARQLIAAADSDVPLFYGLDLLEDWAGLFWKTDTHLAPLGIRQSFEKILSLLGQHPSIRWRAQEPLLQIGNLGGKLSPQRSEASTHEVAVFDTLRLHDEVEPALSANARLRGTRLYHRSNADNEIVCLLLGTSTAYVMRALFFAQFRHVYFVWSNSVDDDLVASLKPDLVICVLSEHFIGSDVSDNLRPVETFDPRLRDG